MDQISSVVKESKRLERILREHYHGSGRGLHELISSCQERLPSDVVKRLRYVATIRNKVVHEDDFKIDDMKAFKLACRYCEQELAPRSHRMMWRLVLFLILTVTACSIWFYFEYWQQYILYTFKINQM